MTTILNHLQPSGVKLSLGDGVGFGTRPGSQRCKLQGQQSKESRRNYNQLL